MKVSPNSLNQMIQIENDDKLFSSPQIFTRRLVFDINLYICAYLDIQE